MTEQQPTGESFGRFIGLLLMGFGVLWIAFCGLCAFGVMATVVSESAGGEALSSTLVVVVISGLAAVGGYAVFVAGRSLWRS